MHQPQTVAAVLAETFKVNSTLTEVNLGCNKIGDTGATALAEAFKVYSAITKVNLDENNIE